MNKKKHIFECGGGFESEQGAKNNFNHHSDIYVYKMQFILLRNIFINYNPTKKNLSFSI